jgi:hypothetical protein
VSNITLRIVVVVVVLTGFAPSSSAQYFGRNKVQYQDLNFRILKTDHFDIYYYPQEEQGVGIAARMSERWLTRLERLFGHTLRGRQPLILYGSHTAFEQTNVIRGELGEGTGGVTEPVRRRIVLPLAGPLGETDHVIGHELVHAFQFDITTRAQRSGAEPGAARLPLWFIEGMAEYLSLGPVDPNTAMWLRDALRIRNDEDRDSLPSIGDLDNPKYFPYRWGQAFWAYVAGRFGDDVIRQMLSIGAAAGDYNIAIEKVLGLKTQALSDQWRASIRESYRPILAGAVAPSNIGRSIVQATDLGRANVGPALSPDGSQVAFLSTRSVFSTDLYVANTRTGEIVHKLTSTATDPHFSSLQFIYSAGAWDSAGKRLAIATVVDGRAALAIFDPASGSKEREIKINDVDEIFNPTWAPNGSAVCFSGMRQGLTDLYVFDLSTSELKALTNDAYADVQPSWSPDGRRIAFATDRFTSDLDTLRFGEYRIGVIDPQTGRIEELRTHANGKSMNPQWSPGSAEVVFIGDPDGIPNVYRVALSGGTPAQVTDVQTGVSGITATSPALAVASTAGTIAVSVYTDGKYSLYGVDPAGSAPRSNVARQSAARLPPIDGAPGEVAGLIHNAALGLPPASTQYPTQPYKGSLSLEGLAPPTIGVGASRFGAAVAGGIGFQFSDMLGNQTLTAAVQLDSGVGGSYSVKNTAFQAGYLNEAHRWMWGLTGSQLPYLSGTAQSGLGQISNEPVLVDQTIIFRQTEQTGAAVVAYPFSRAQRIEFQGGISHLTFDRIVQTQAFSLGNGQLVLDDSQATSLQSPLTLGTTSAALVFDTANFGATSPVAGTRYRFEASPTFGAIRYTGFLADYRKYFMPAPFYTLATRVLHYGRYGSGGEDQRLFPLFVGYPNLVRGYDVNTFEPRDCVPTSTSSCPAFDRLLGSRVLVGNVEFRFPLLRPFGASQRMYGPLPVEVALFADGGVAWNSGQKPSFLGGSKEGVASAGLAFRINLLGFAVAQIDLARPFQREQRGWVFQFNLAPGF